MVGLCGPPGAGKSRAAALLVYALRCAGVSTGQVPMDGYHLSNRQLDTFGARDRKGAPDTFDVAGFRDMLSRVRQCRGETIYAPDFSRPLDEPIAAVHAVPADARVIVTEGNYLMFETGGWEHIRHCSTSSSTSTHPAARSPDVSCAGTATTDGTTTEHANGCGPSICPMRKPSSARAPAPISCGDRSRSLSCVRVLVIGSGAREHALALALSRDPGVTAVLAAPGNPGIANVAELFPVDAASADSVVALATEQKADLVVIGPEVPLVLGVADAVRAAGIPCFGPSAAAARIEGSKAFAKDVMAAAGVRTAHSEVVDTPATLDEALDRFGPTWVVKDDGLAAGKGVVVTTERAAARDHAAEILENGHPVLLESFLDGPEVSLFCLVDGETVVPLLPAQDHKRVGEGDTGPNTGGMGAYTPLPWLPEAASSGSSPRSSSPSRPRWCAADAVSPDCSTRVWRWVPGARPWSSSTAVSATRRPRPCSPCSSPRWARP